MKVHTVHVKVVEKAVYGESDYNPYDPQSDSPPLTSSPQMDPQAVPEGGPEKEEVSSQTYKTRLGCDVQIVVVGVAQRILPAWQSVC